jgi:hypothetical protein
MERNKLVSKMIDTRNNFTQYSEELESKSVEGVAHYLLRLKMEVIF